EVLVIGAVVGQRHEVEALPLALPDLVGDGVVALCAILRALARQTAVARVIVVDVQVALEPEAALATARAALLHRQRAAGGERAGERQGKQRTFHGGPGYRSAAGLAQKRDTSSTRIRERRSDYFWNKPA